MNKDARWMTTAEVKIKQLLMSVIKRTLKKNVGKLFRTFFCFSSAGVHGCGCGCDDTLLPDIFFFLFGGGGGNTNRKMRQGLGRLWYQHVNCGSRTLKCTKASFAPNYRIYCERASDLFLMCPVFASEYVYFSTGFYYASSELRSCTEFSWKNVQ